MIKTLLVGAAVGILGKKLYDEGTLDPYLSNLKERLPENLRQYAPNRSDQSAASTSAASNIAPAI